MNENNKKYRVMFASGNALVVNFDDFLIVTDISGLLRLRHTPNKNVLFFDKIDYIIPEPEGESSIVHTPTVQTVKEQEEKKRQEIVGNPKAVLSDIVKTEGE